ncbi:MAG: TetR/AcrR family transcriptional regulator [Jatrophihabitans sp.]
MDGQPVENPAGPAATDGRRLRWADHRSARRTAFVIAGVGAIDAHGPNVSAEQIAEFAGVSRTVLYRYFRDREDLRQAIAERVVQDVLDRVLPKLALTPDSTPRQIISSAISTILTWLDEHPNLYRLLRSRRDGLESVETTLATTIAVLLTVVLGFFGIEAEEAEPGAYGIVGYVEAAGAWWLANRSMSREKFTDLICTGVWHLLEGTARDHGLVIDYDKPLPIAALVAQVTES